MPETKGRKPEDHKQKKAEVELATQARIDQERLLKDMPTLVAPERLRFAEKARIRAIMVDAAASGVFDDLKGRAASAGDEDSGFSTDDAEDIKKIDALVVQIDEFAESIANDPHEYAEWARGKGYDEFFAILNRYDGALGELTGS